MAVPKDAPATSNADTINTRMTSHEWGLLIALSIL